MIIFEYTEYKDYLNNALGSGKRSQFAKFIGCQPSFLSQVLRGSPDLSLEQGLVANDFFHHTQQETQYFMLLLQKSRAGSKRLKEYFHKEMETLKSQRQKVAGRVSSSIEIPEEKKALYYSSWIYPTLHVLLSISTDDQVEFVSGKLGLAKELIMEAIEFLTSIGLIGIMNGKFCVLNHRIHTPASSPYTLQHHRNFRLQVIRHLDSFKSRNIHFSSILALSRKDVKKIESILLNAIEDSEKVLIPSPEEAAYLLCLDFAEL